MVPLTIAYAFAGFSTTSLSRHGPTGDVTWGSGAALRALYFVASLRFEAVTAAAAALFLSLVTADCFLFLSFDFGDLSPMSTPPSDLRHNAVGHRIKQYRD